MIKVYDVVRVKSSCTDTNLIGRIGLVIDVDDTYPFVRVILNYIDYVVAVPEAWLHKEGVLCQRDRRARMALYAPGCVICNRYNPSQCEILSHFTFMPTDACESAFETIYRNIYTTRVYTETGKTLLAGDLDNFVVIGGGSMRDYSECDKWNTLKEEIQMKTQSQSACNPIKKVIFNDPATIVFWNDGSKTVVQARGEDFDPEKGLAMAICRHYLCDICHLKEYQGVFLKYLRDYHRQCEEGSAGMDYNPASTIKKGMENLIAQCPLR